MQAAERDVQQQQQEVIRLQKESEKLSRHVNLGFGVMFVLLLFCFRFQAACRRAGAKTVVGSLESS